MGAATFNPFLLRLEARDVALTTGGGEPLVAVDRFVADLRWASLVRRTWILDAVHLGGIDARLERAADGRYNFVPPAAARARDEPPPPAANEAQDTAPPPLRIEALSLDAAQLTLVDHGGATPAQLTVGPIALQATQLTTLPGPAGQFRMQATLPAGGALEISGELDPAAPSSTGRLAVTGLQATTLWPFVQEQWKLAPPQGRADLSATYRFGGGDAAVLVVDGIDVGLSGVVLAPPGADAAPLLALDTAALHGGRFDLGRRELEVAQLELADGTLRLAIDRAGVLDWSALGRGDAGAEHTAAAWRIALRQVAVDRLALHYADQRPSPAQTIAVDAVAADFAVAVETGGAQARVVVDEAAATLGGVALAPNGAQTAARIGALALAGGRIDSAARRLGAHTISVDGGEATVVRHRDGRLEVAGIAAAAADTPATADVAKATAHVADAGDAPAAAQASWRYAVGTFAIKDFAVDYADRGFEPALAYRVTLSARLSDIDRDAAGPVGFEADARFASKGRLRARGTLAQDGSRVEARADLAGFALPPLAPVLSRYAALDLVAGRLGATARLTYAAAGRPRLEASGTLGLEDFRVNEAVGGDRFLSAAKLAARGKLTLDPDRLLVEEIDVREPGAKLVISAEREFNLVQVLKKPPGEGAAPPAPGAAGATPAVAEQPFDTRIERVELHEGVVDFADYSLVLPFSTRVEALNGTALGIDTRGDEPAVLEAEGRIEPYGSARVEGRVRSRAPTELTDIRVEFDNVPMPPLSPYTATFAGRTVSSGELWLELHYKIDDGRLAGENRVTLENFTLGERVEAPDALDLPLDLAVGLLKDERGRIDLAVPVEGDVNNPEFAYGRVIRAALGQTLRRIVTAPFRFLAGLLGRERADELARVEFEPGSDRLAPPEQEDLLDVVKALAQRPQLRLAVAAPYDPRSDARALRVELVRRGLAEALGRRLEPGARAGPIDFGDARTRAALETLLERRQRAGGERRAEAEAAADGATPVAAGDEATPEAAADESAPYRAMFERLVESAPLTENALRVLAVERARAITRFLVEEGGIAPERIESGAIHAVDAAGESVPAQLEVGVRGDASS